MSYNVAENSTGWLFNSLHDDEENGGFISNHCVVKQRGVHMDRQTHMDSGECNGQEYNALHFA